VADHFAAVGWVGDLARARRLAPGTSGAADHGLCAALLTLVASAQFVFVGEVGAHGIVPVLLAANKVDRQRDAGMGWNRSRSYQLDRVADQIVDRHVLVGDAVDEAGVGAVFQQATHQVRQQSSCCRPARTRGRARRGDLRDHFGIQVVPMPCSFWYS
jgi:hypothetical protein